MIYPLIGLPFVELPSIVTNLGAALGTAAGIGFGIWRGKQTKNLIKQVLELVQVYRKAKEDGEVTPKETEQIFNELADVAIAAVDVWKFSKKARTI